MAYEQSASRPDARELSQIEVATAIGNVSKSDGPTSSSPVAAGGSPVPIGQATGLNSISSSVSMPVPVNSGVSLSSVPVTLASGTTPAIAAAATGAIASESVSVFDVVSSDFSTHEPVFFLIAWNLKAGQQQGWLLILLTILNRAMTLSSKYRFTRVVVPRSSYLKLLQH